MSLNVTNLPPISAQAHRDRRPDTARPSSVAPSASVAHAGESRALVPIGPARETPMFADTPTPTASRRTDAAYLAHLIATAERMPQTRARCRAEPAAAAAFYRNVTARVVTDGAPMDCVRVG